MSVLVPAVPQVASIQKHEYAIVVHHGACPWPLQGNTAKTWAEAQMPSEKIPTTEIRNQDPTFVVVCFSSAWSQ